jgi:hypothetical protein
MTRQAASNCLLVFVLAAVLGATWFSVDATLAQADAVSFDAGAPAADAAAAPPASVEPAPIASSSSLADPTVAPIQAVSQLAQLEHVGWPLALLAVLIMLSRAGVALAPRYALTAKLERGKRLMVVAGVGTVAAAAFNTVALGGSWTAALVGAAGVVFAMLSPHAPQKLAAAAVEAKQSAITAVLVLVALVATGCATFQHDAKVVGAAVVDCTKSELVANIAPMASLLLPLLQGHSITAGQAEDVAVNLGGDVGGCLESQVNDELASASSAAAAGPGAPAKLAAPTTLSVDRYRARTHQKAVYKTARGTH